MGKFLEKLDIVELFCMIACVAAWVGFSFLTPNHLYLPPQNAEYNYPYKSREIIPVVVLEIITFPGVWLFFIMFYFIQKKLTKIFKQFNIFPLIWTHISTVSITNSVVLILQNFVGRAGVDFYSRCGASATPDTCTFLDKNTLHDLLRSFPSTHAASAMSSYLFFTLYLQKLIKYKSTPLTILEFLPVFVGLWIGATRITDYKAHPCDVVAGYVIGTLITLVFWKTSKHVVFKVINSDDDENNEKHEVEQSLVS
ncbi:PAP2 superfamily protein [Trichomonas vaginalis G3]|uniref:PAP2 superfamily protein n=1 Tax=Trichomonas vaginalis (strain ATCC PRA-98 / G3) TaxID=412133 RepID=A2FQV1_TRIV3|nr:phosphatidate phosphatase protein [Trichomonas vaginalis G3]EAX92720.1 PAP2 superfamily protein [Trichomonas vaginalis G3]KAI5517978.1 phosphatidate phosphatase protein [Trichomonas vaginalis G3]|eukprot:XP_001305650.1 PAP2 superfamily protein [Trichomonas vaginalis G3]